jgi:transposase
MEMNLSLTRLRAYSYKELATLYGISHRTLKNWLEPFKTEIGEKRGRYFTVKQMEVVFKRLGYPKDFDEAA